MFKKSTLLFLTAISVILILLNSYFGFWWINLIIAFCVSYIFIFRYSTAFLMFFTIVFLLWTGTSIWKDMQVSYAVSIFLSQISGSISPKLTYLFTALVGGLMTGWAGVLGSSLRTITHKKQQLNNS